MITETLKYLKIGSHQRGNDCQLYTYDIIMAGGIYTCMNVRISLSKASAA